MEVLVGDRGSNSGASEYLRPLVLSRSEGTPNRMVSFITWRFYCIADAWLAKTLFLKHNFN